MKEGITIDLQFVAGSDEDLETAFLLNSSPAFEFAAYTVAALTNTQPTVAIQGENVDITAATLVQNGATVLDKVTISFEQGHKATTHHSGSGTTKRSSTDPALQTLVDQMWNVDQDRPSAAQVTLNWGTKISGKSGIKEGNLFANVDETLFTKKQYADLLTTYQNELFTADVCKAEAPMSGFRKQYLQAVFNAFTSTPMFSAAFDYLKAQNYKDTSDLETFKSKVLWPLWFGTYTRCKGALGSSGWEHVFSGELKSNEVDGQHDWVRYYTEQKKDKMVYNGYYTHDEDLIGTFQYHWQGATKPKGGFFTGTSPAFDFSILSVCALVHGNGGNCHFHVNNYPITVTSYLQQCGDGSGTCLSTAYPG
uniref:Poly(U)-specific endoribonuclease n=1 Tax=Caenorhabditis japonica TaxID=281687 RepID=A0A8R1HVZ2_CAEJA